MANEEIRRKKEIKLVLRDGKEYSIRPLVLDKLIEVWPVIEELRSLAEKELDKESLEKMKKLAYVALTNSGLSVDEAKIGELVDLDDITRIIGIIVGQKL